MKNKLSIVYAASLLAILIPMPGRLAYGLIFIISFNLVVLFSTLLSSLYIKLKMDMYLWVLMPLTYVFLITVIKLTLAYISPVLALQLGFLFYIQFFSIYVQNILHNVQGTNLKSSIIAKLQSGLWFTGIVFVFSLIRDILGYGTISLPTTRGLLSFELFSIEVVPQITIFASIFGAAILSALAIVLFIRLEDLHRRNENE